MPEFQMASNKNLDNKRLNEIFTCIRTVPEFGKPGIVTTSIHLFCLLLSLSQNVNAWGFPVLLTAVSSRTAPSTKYIFSR